MYADFGGIFPNVENPKRGPGRPKMNLDPLQRRQHISLALIYFGSTWTLARVAKMYDVSTDTARRWIRSALDYDEPEANRVRILAGKSQRKVKYPN